MKSSTVVILAVAMLARAAIGASPAFASTMLKSSSHEGGAGTENFEIRAQRGQGSRPLPEVVANWLATKFDLSIYTPPRITFVPRNRLSGLRFRGVPSDHLGDGRDVVAVYDDDAHTIYLPLGWMGRTPAESSMLVHEMVHHAQNLAGKRFECPQAREELAYEAQERWLVQSGSSLAREFAIDGFTRLVLTTCGP